MTKTMQKPVSIPNSVLVYLAVCPADDQARTVFIRDDIFNF